MSSANHDFNKLHWWHWAAPLAAAGLVLAKTAHLVEPAGLSFAAPAVILLAGAVFAAVHHAEVLAARVGQPFGSILLALSITALEIGLIISVMLSGTAGSNDIARDTVYSVFMIVLNGIVGASLVAGSLRHFQQEYSLQGAVGILSVIATLAVFALILPNYTLTTPGATYSQGQLIFVGSISLFLYCLFVFVQTIRHRSDFVIEYASETSGEPPSCRSVATSTVLLAVSLVSVIMLSKSLSPIISNGVLSAGLPHAVVGVIIAIVVLLPEGLTAMKAATQNRLQTSLNASLGSVAATLGLTIPIVGLVSVAIGAELTLGIDEEASALLMLTLLVSILTFATGRTTVLQGAVHLVIFGVFLFLSAVP